MAIINGVNTGTGQPQTRQQLMATRAFNPSTWTPDQGFSDPGLHQAMRADPAFAAKVNSAYTQKFNSLSGADQYNFYNQNSQIGNRLGTQLGINKDWINAYGSSGTIGANGQRINDVNNPATQGASLTPGTQFGTTRPAGYVNPQAGQGKTLESSPTSNLAPAPTLGLTSGMYGNATLDASGNTVVGAPPTPTPAATTTQPPAGAGTPPPPGAGTPPPPGAGTPPPAGTTPPATTPPATTAQPTGIINAGAMPTEQKATTGTAVTGQVTPDQTVQGQLSNILKTGNPLLDAARARAMQAANARGLQNSSMAAQAGEEAVVSQALPIASEDASAYRQQALTNQNAQNQMALQNVQNQAQLDNLYQQFKDNNFINDKDNALKQYISDSSLSMQQKIAAMQDATSRAAIQERLQETGMNIDATVARDALNWTHQQATNLLNLQTQDFNSFSAGFQAILNNKDMEPAAKTNAYNNLKLVYSGVAMPDGFTFPDLPAA